MQDPHKEDYKTLMSEIKDLNKGTDTACSLVDLNIFKMSFLHNMTYGFNAIPIKIPISYVVVFESLFEKAKTQNSQHYTEKNDNIGGLILYDLL